MPDIQNQASGPIERIEQVRRFDIIKLLELASTRLFHRGDKTHAADLTQAALYMRQDAEKILSASEVACIRAVGAADAVASIVDRVKPSMGSFYLDRGQSAGYAADSIKCRIDNLVTDLENRTNEAQALQHEVYALEQRIKNAAKARRKKREKRRSRK